MRLSDDFLRGLATGFFISGLGAVLIGVISNVRGM
jgi:hypothetical protein